MRHQPRPAQANETRFRRAAPVTTSRRPVDGDRMMIGLGRLATWHWMSVELLPVMNQDDLRAGMAKLG